MKDGKIGRKDGQPLPGEDEPLHAYVTANNPENVKKAVEKVGSLIAVVLFNLQSWVLMFVPVNISYRYLYLQI